MVIRDIYKLDQDMINQGLADMHRTYAVNGIDGHYSRGDEGISEAINAWQNNKELLGAAMYEEDKLVGFLLAELKKDGLRRKAWVPAFGLSAFGEDEDKILYELYRYAATKWLKQGYFEHVIETLALTKRIVSLQQLGFAHEQAYGLIRLEDLDVGPALSGFTIRSLNDKDRENLKAMADIIYSYQNASPVFAPAQPELVNEIRQGYMGLIEDEEVRFYMVEGDKPVAFQALWDEDSAYLIPDKTIELSIAGTYANVSHQGIGSGLMAHVAQELLADGYEWIALDWRVTNISSRRFWKDKCGAIMTKQRMVRSIDESLAWANFENVLY